MRIHVFPGQISLARASAREAASRIRDAIAAFDGARIVAATGNSQMAFLDALTRELDIDWSKVEMFHLDEYVGLSADHPASFRKYLRERLIDPTGMARFHLLDVMNEPTATLPYGKQRLLEIAVAIAARPRVLLLDEPAAGVPESERQDILAAVSALPRDVTVLLIEHDMDLVFSFADRISVLVNGAMLVEGAPEAVARDPQVKAVYLGEAADA